jgi:hypothetical protein
LESKARLFNPKNAIELAIPRGLATGLPYFRHSALDAESSYFIFLDSCFRRNDNRQLKSLFALDTPRSCRGEVHSVLSSFADVFFCSLPIHRLFSKSPDPALDGTRKSGNFIIFENTNCIFRVQ